MFRLRKRDEQVEVWAQAEQTRDSGVSVTLMKQTIGFGGFGFPAHRLDLSRTMNLSEALPRA